MRSAALSDRSAGACGGIKVRSAEKPVCGASAKPRGKGVPAADSAGGGAGLPDFPREGRGLVGVSWPLLFGGFAITADYGAGRRRGQGGGASVAKLRQTFTHSWRQWVRKVGITGDRPHVREQGQSRHGHESGREGQYRPKTCARGGREGYTRCLLF